MVHGSLQKCFVIKGLNGIIDFRIIQLHEIQAVLGFHRKKQASVKDSNLFFLLKKFLK